MHKMRKRPCYDSMRKFLDLTDRKNAELVYCL